MEEAQFTFYALYGPIQTKDLKSMVLESESQCQARRIICDCFSIKTPGYELNLFMDFVSATTKRGANRLNLHTILSHITSGILLRLKTHQTSDIPRTTSPTLNCCLLLLWTNRQTRCRNYGLTLHRTTGAIHFARVKQVIDYIFKTLQHPTQVPHDRA